VLWLSVMQSGSPRKSGCYLPTSLHTSTDTSPTTRRADRKCSRILICVRGYRYQTHTHTHMPMSTPGTSPPCSTFRHVSLLPTTGTEWAPSVDVTEPQAILFRQAILTSGTKSNLEIYGTSWIRPMGMMPARLHISRGFGSSFSWATVWPKRSG
jgi:hypothetical protein